MQGLISEGMNATLARRYAADATECLLQLKRLEQAQRRGQDIPNRVRMATPCHRAPIPGQEQKDS